MDVEGIGIRKGIKVIAKSFFKILLVNPFEFNEEYYSQVKDIEFDLVIFSHEDQREFLKYYQQAVSKLNDISNDELRNKTVESIWKLYKPETDMNKAEIEYSNLFRYYVFRKPSVPKMRNYKKDVTI